MTLSPLPAPLSTLSGRPGNTPLMRVDFLDLPPDIELYAKLEWSQPGASVKARPAFAILAAAIAAGTWQPGMHMLDATSGNTGIAYATFCQAAGIPLTLCLPENASKERKEILARLGVNVVLTSPYEGTDGAKEVALDLVLKAPGKYAYLDQYSNPANWRAHYETTAPEVLSQTRRRLTHFVAGLGTTGTFTGTGRRLREELPDVRLIALQPETALHGLEGWKHLETAAIPAIHDPSLADEVRTVATEDSFAMIRQAAAAGLGLSPSAAANLAGTLAAAREHGPGVYVTVFADDASKYSEVYDHLKIARPQHHEP